MQSKMSSFSLEWFCVSSHHGDFINMLHWFRYISHYKIMNTVAPLQKPRGSSTSVISVS